MTKTIYPIPELYKNDFKDIKEFNHFLSQVEHWDGLPRPCDHCGGGMASFWMHDGGWAVCSRKCFNEDTAKALKCSVDDAEKLIDRYYEWMDKNDGEQWYNDDNVIYDNALKCGLFTEEEVGLVSGCFYTDLECVEDYYGYEDSDFALNQE